MNESAKGAIVIEYGHRTGTGQSGYRKQSFVLPFQVEMESGRMVFDDRREMRRRGHRHFHVAQMQPGGAIQILPLDF